MRADTVSPGVLEDLRPDPTQRPDTVGRTAALLTICMGFFMVSLDATVVNVALHALRAGMHASMSGLQRTVDGYTLVFAALLLTAGALGDRHGPASVFRAGLLAFAVASALCGLAPGAWTLVAARAPQGIGAALLVSTSLSCSRPSTPAPAHGLAPSACGVASAALRMPYLPQIWANAAEVYCDPRSAWKITPVTSPPRAATAARSASTKSSARRCGAIE
jgi:MFS family permease